MKLSLCLVILASVCLISPASAQEPVEDVRTSIGTPASCPTGAPVPVTIEAPVIRMVGSVVGASDGLRFEHGRQLVTASRAFYDLAGSNGRFERVTFTTCDHQRPDYRLEAREVTLLPNRKLYARGLSLYLGRTRVLALPSMNMRIGGRAATADVFPRPSFDKNDGLSLAQRLRLVDANRARATADLTLSTSRGIEGQLDGRYGLDGNLESFPGRFLTYQSLRSGAMTLPIVTGAASCVPCDSDGGAARFQGFGIFSLKQRTYDIKNTGLVVYRQPEVGLTYIGRQLSLTRTRLNPRMEIYPMVVGSWGRFKESPGAANFINRDSLDLIAPVNLISMGSQTSLQGVFGQSWSVYETGQSYRVTLLGADMSHMFNSGTVVAGRYLKRNESGTTPFQFDNVDIEEEFQGSFQVQLGSYTAGFVGAYDLEAKDLYEWEVLYGYQTDCLASWVTWNNRLQRLSFHIALVNL